MCQQEILFAKFFDDEEGDRNSNRQNYNLQFALNSLREVYGYQLADIYQLAGKQDNSREFEEEDLVEDEKEDEEYEEKKISCKNLSQSKVDMILMQYLKQRTYFIKQYRYVFAHVTRYLYEDKSLSKFTQNFKKISMQQNNKNNTLQMNQIQNNEMALLKFIKIVIFHYKFNQKNERIIGISVMENELLPLQICIKTNTLHIFSRLN